MTTPAEPPSSTAPKQFEQLLKESLLLYRRAFPLLASIVAIGTLISTLLQIAWGAEGLAGRVAWFMITMVPVIVAQAAATAMAWRVEHEKPVHLLHGYLIALGVAPVYVPGVLLLLIVLGATISSFLVFPLGLPIGALGFLLLTRWSLFGPLVVVEQRRIVDAFRTSATLVKGYGWRTLGMFAFVWGAIFFVILAGGYATNSAHTGVQLVSSVALWAIALPLANVFTLLVYEDYRKLRPVVPLDSPELPTPPDSAA